MFPIHFEIRHGVARSVSIAHLTHTCALSRRALHERLHQQSVFRDSQVNSGYGCF
ncbi:hypothetical protein AWB65_04421 [Caballeronia humi]|jgi:hypothetical protein|uniref:Uncharacterized protein n=1 Tax=Caballeronia humi TaxID=326474 RepID=A0A158I9J1_9BURK|nr:hypothetical protein AWB65_04421 [Caballeronia humi]